MDGSDNNNEVNTLLTRVRGQFVDPSLMEHAHDSIRSQARHIYALMEGLEQDGVPQHTQQFLAYVHLEDDGGVYKIESLWSFWKVLYFFIVVLGIVANVTMLFMGNYEFLKRYRQHASEDTECFLGHHSLQPAGVRRCDLYERVELRSSLPIYQLAAGVAVFELICLSAFLMFSIGDCFRFLCHDDYHAYAAMARVALRTLPTTATFSALKMLRTVHPNLIGDHIEDALKDPFFGESDLAHKFQIAYFILYAFCFALAGVVAFTVKIIEVGVQFSDPNVSRLTSLFYTVTFLNQVMGIVVLDHVLQERVFLFIFGGEDVELDHDERVLKKVYLARVMRAIWHRYWEKGNYVERLQGIVMILTFDHYDLQRLVIRENVEEKARIEQEYFEEVDAQDELRFQHHRLEHASQTMPPVSTYTKVAGGCMPLPCMGTRCDVMPQGGAVCQGMQGARTLPMAIQVIQHHNYY